MDTCGTGAAIAAGIVLIAHLSEDWAVAVAQGPEATPTLAARPLKRTCDMVGLYCSAVGAMFSSASPHGSLSAPHSASCAHCLHMAIQKKQ